MRKSVKEATEGTQQRTSRISLREKLREQAIFLFGAAVGIAFLWLASSIYTYAKSRVVDSCVKYEMVEIEGRYFECREIGG